MFAKVNVEVRGDGNRSTMSHLLPPVATSFAHFCGRDRSREAESIDWPLETIGLSQLEAELRNVEGRFWAWLRL